MVWTEPHARIMAKSFEKVLGRAEPGSMAFVRCLTPDVVAALASDMAFAPYGWLVRRVADVDEERTRTTT